MGAVITVMNMKGGVGKTTVTMNVGGLLGCRQLDGVRRRVLLIDYDPQFNLSQAFIAAKQYYQLERARKTTLAILQDDETDLNPYELQLPSKEIPPSVIKIAHNFYEYNSSKLDIVPSTIDLMYIALGHSTQRTIPIENRFKKFIEECKKKYDVILIDCHPAGSIFTKTSLQNSDHVLIPVAPERFAVRGIGLMMQFIKAQKKGTVAPEPHILFNLGVSDELEGQIRGNSQFKDHCLKRVLRKFKAFSDPQDGDGFCWTSGKPYSTQAYFNLCGVVSELVERTGA